MFKKLMTSKKLRTRTSWLVAIILIPPFIIAFHSFMAPPEQNNPAVNAGTLFGEPVSRETFDLHYLAMRRNLENRMAAENEGFTSLPEVFNSIIEQQTWSRLLLLHEAKQRRLNVSDQELADIIRNTPAFQVNERFAPDRYAQVIRAIGMTPTIYEDFLRDEIRIAQLVDTVRREAFVTDAEVHDAYREANERMRAGVLFSGTDSFRESVRAELTDAVLQEAYDSRPQLVRTPERVTFKLAGMNEAALRDSVEIPEEDIQIYYEANYDAGNAEPEFSGEQEILHESAITPELAKPEIPTLEEVREEIIEAIRPRHVRRALNLLIADMEDIAKEGQSLDALAASLELPVTTVGPIERGGTSADLPDPGLLNEAFSLSAGETSSLIETNNGAYFIEVTTKEPAAVPPFESVKQKISKILEDERAREAARAQTESWRTQLTEALGAGTSIEEALEGLGTEVTEPEAFSRDEPIIAFGLPLSASRMAFETPLGEPTELVQVPAGSALLIPREILSPDEAGLAEAEEALRGRVLQEKQDAHFSEWLSALRAEADIQDFSKQEQMFQPGDVIEGPTGEPITIPAS